MSTDYAYLAHCLASLAGIPVRFYMDGKFQKLYHHTQFKPDLAILEEPNIFRSQQNVSYYMDENFLYYGLFRVTGQNVALILGPVAQITVDHRTAGNILRHMGEPQTRVQEILRYFSAMPAYPLRNFLQILCAVNYFINGEKLDVSQLLTGNEDFPPMPVEESTADSRHYTTHNTMELEARMLSDVQHGRVDAIRELFREPTGGQAGTMARDTLRQQKNLLICTATLVTRAAIKGGLNCEEAFALSDNYIQKAELMGRIEDLVRLNSQMVLDFAQRVNRENHLTRNSELLHKTRQYVLRHIDQPIRTEDISRELGMNRTYLCSAFREETGMTLMQYVTQVKLDEAQRLLQVTDKSISEIAYYLGYSSQGYFQNVFKKVLGVTPGKYRQKSG